MTTSQDANQVPDDRFIRFEVQDGSRRVGCMVSGEALEAAAGLALPSTSLSRRRSFDRFRTLINAAAKLKLAGTAQRQDGCLILESEDLRRVPPEAGVPLFGSFFRDNSRAARVLPDECGALAAAASDDRA
ncbi:DUF1488 family protein [Gluconacetobacter tumulisoli]|uniref:DUF1488 family protein n=1 Tax=Gluconacetobacter tumulisoli TaxID=1286189 RepID=A0A7W4K5T3_9PROT|nr:DUF1488 family protein [Gluconacetobacter tumulisoli]MBB2200886.1 DUF1488 family protein [Gluconacetobacter tumulisoli]